MAKKRRKSQLTSAISIQQLAADLVTRREANHLGATVVLGAGAASSSGIPLWPDLAEAVCRELGLSTTGRKSTDVLAEHLNNSAVPYSQRYALFQKHLKGKRPSIGYSHLAQLVKDELVSTILTTNWDSLAEIALAKAISFDSFKVLARGELSDSTIAETLRWRKGFPTVVKLHGDIQAKRFMLGRDETRRVEDSLFSALEDCLSSCSFIVGQSAQDVDLLTVILKAKREHGALYHVRHGAARNEIDRLIAAAHGQAVEGLRPSVLAEGSDVNIGDFDSFFTQLDLAVQQQLTERRRMQLRKAEASILEKERTGVGYINYTKITDLIRHFTLGVKEASPDLILFIDDPSAPGGMELQRRMLPVMLHEGLATPTATIRIEGKSGTRTHERSITSDLTKLPMRGVKKVLILDAITFSGNTLAMARDGLKKAFPRVAVKMGVLVISEQLEERQRGADQDEGQKYLRQTVTDRAEIFFPWGVTHLNL